MRPVHIVTFALAGALAACGPAMVGDTGARPRAGSPSETQWQTHIKAAEMAWGQANQELAEREFRDALAVAEGWGDFDPRLAATHGALGQILEARQALPEAEHHHRRALSIAERAFGRDDVRTAVAIDALARVSYYSGREAETERLMKRSLAIRESGLPADSQELSGARLALAQFYRSAGRPAEAIPLIEAALEQMRRAIGEDAPMVAAGEVELGLMLLSADRMERGAGLIDNGVLMLERAYSAPGDQRDTRIASMLAFGLGAKADMAGHSGDLAEALGLARRSLDLLKEAGDEDQMQAALERLAGISFAEDAREEGDRYAREALALAEEDLGSEDPEFAAYLASAAELYRHAGMPDEVERLYRRALGIWEGAFGPDHPNVASALNNLATILHEAGRLDEADTMTARAVGLLEKALGPDHAYLAMALANRAQILHDLGRKDEARTLEDRAERIERGRVQPSSSTRSR